jgi:hypothetical protein
LDVHSWTEEEARAYLPRLRALLAVLRRAAEMTARARGNGHSKPLEDLVGRPVLAELGEEPSASTGEPAADLARLGPAEALAELEQRGVIVRDPARGLVDFPSERPSGRVVLLCWELGEEDLGWWHLPEEGFAGRRPLPVPPEL